MACNSCAARLRNYVLPHLEYELTDGMWDHPDHPSIPDADLDSGHAAITTTITLRHGAKLLANIFGRVFEKENGGMIT